MAIYFIRDLQFISCETYVWQFISSETYVWQFISCETSYGSLFHLRLTYGGAFRPLIHTGVILRLCHTWHSQLSCLDVVHCPNWTLHLGHVLRHSRLRVIFTHVIRVAVISLSEPVVIVVKITAGGTFI